MQTPKVSVIIPVYQVEAYLSRCVDSILAQTFAAFELILVDDGSSDAGGEICDAYAAKDSRIRVIHQKNAGVSAARNAGLQAAKGTYIGFVDADDWVFPDYLQTLLDEAVKECADIVMCDTVTIWDSGKEAPDTIPLLPTDTILSHNDFYPELLAQMAGSACRCLYATELLQEIFFPVGIRFSEDRLFNLQAMGRAKRIRYIKRGLYGRYVREGSVCNRYHGDLFAHNLLVYERAVHILETHWDGRYLPIYTRICVINGALSAIYEICSRAYHGNRRLAEIQSIISHEMVRNAFQICPPCGLRETLLHKQRCVCLALVGFLYQIRHMGF